MGNILHFLQYFQQPPASSTTTNTQLKVATLNYCGISHSPFQFYTKGYEQELAQISRIFKKLIPLYISDFNENFSWKMGKIDKKFNKGRYSNMFSPQVGCYQGRLITKHEFEQIWDHEFNIQSAALNFNYSKEERQMARTFDFIMYHTLLAFAFKTESFEHAITNTVSQFKFKIQRFYSLSFMDEKAKLNKFMQGFTKLSPDVFFIQEYSKLLLAELRSSNRHLVITDPKEDSLILLNKSTFSKFQDFKVIIEEINQEQRKNFRWAESVALVGADNYVFICVHLSSNEAKNKEQIQNLKKDLLLLRQHLPKYEIVVGGDLNSFMKVDKELGSSYHLYPHYEWEFTTLKKRTYSQAQYHKAEKQVIESKDRIMSTCNIEWGEVMYLTGEKADQKTYLPSDEHPYDHLLCCVRIRK